MTVVIDHRAAAAPESGAAGLRPAKPAALYRRREPIHPKRVRGRWRAIKWAVLIATLAVYYATPWIRWDRPGQLPDQAVLVDLAQGRFYFFGVQLWAQEVYYLTGLLVMAALALFLVSALFGRLWCGYACPQTVWTDLYIAVERLFEGDRAARLRLDKAPWTAGKAARKAGKHVLWLIIAAATGGAWVFYFHDAPSFWSALGRGPAPAGDYLAVGLLTSTTYSLAGMMREQVCTYMCPWPRIQGAMLDAHSLQVAYRYDRGEPRGPHKQGSSWLGRGDCVDCRQCVVACPMGVDIRKGLQLACINCALCIDACDEIMAKVGRPRGLIGFDTDAAIAARAGGRRASYRFVRGRTLYYAAALILVGGLMAFGLATRATVHLEASHDRNPEFIRLKDGAVRNGFTLKLSNRGVEPAPYALSFSGPAGARLSVVGLPPGELQRLEVEPSRVRTLRAFVTVSSGAPHASAPGAFIVRNTRTGEVRRVKTVLLSGGAG